MKDKIVFEVTGENKMHCGGCSSGVRFALSQVPGVKSVNADHKTQLIEVEMGSEGGSEDELIKALDQIGYQVAAAK